MLGIHPVRWVRRLLRSTLRKAVAVMLVLSGTGMGGAYVHTDGALGREAAEFVNGIVRPGGVEQPAGVEDPTGVERPR